MGTALGRVHARPSPHKIVLGKVALGQVFLQLLRFSLVSVSQPLREERRLKVFENRVLRRVFGPKRDEVKGKWRKLHNEELNDCTPYPVLCGW
jgi:hypothetical protein